jgi:AcrR family transcriptional regulator
VPTGIALRDARERLFGAAERVLLQDGPSALTSRAVTTAAGVAKGVMHRHFADFDNFLAELVLDRAARLEGQAAGLLASAGTATVRDNLTDALVALFDPVAVAIVGLVISRDGLRARLRHAGADRIPLLAQGSAMIASYLGAERDLGRIAADADIDTLARTLVGAAHLLFADRESTRSDTATVHRMVSAVMAGSTEPSPSTR